MQRIEAEIVRNDIGLVIRYNRERKGISQEDLAKKVGVSRTYLNLVENRERVPSFTLLREIANQLGKTTADLGLEAISTNYEDRPRILVLKAKLLIKGLIKSGDKEKQKKVADFIESLLAPGRS